MKLLIFNGFPFHHEMLGCILEWCKQQNIIPSVYMLFLDSWINVYNQKYKFNIIIHTSINIEEYDYQLILTDDDKRYPKEWITENTYCFDHINKTRATYIPHHIPIRPFKDLNNERYILPVFNLIEYENKMNLIKKNAKPIITFLGGNGPKNIEQINLIKNMNKYKIRIIARVNSILFDLNKLPLNVEAHLEPPSDIMIKFLLESDYMILLDNNEKHTDGISLSSCIPISYTTGCRLVISNKTNTLFKFKSPILYDDIIDLPEENDLKSVFNERETLLQNNFNYFNDLFQYPHGNHESSVVDQTDASLSTPSPSHLSTP